MRIAAYLGAAHGGRSVNTVCKPLILQKERYQPDRSQKITLFYFYCWNQKHDTNF